MGVFVIEVLWRIIIGRLDCGRIRQGLSLIRDDADWEGWSGQQESAMKEGLNKTRVTRDNMAPSRGKKTENLSGSQKQV